MPALAKAGMTEKSLIKILPGDVAAQNVIDKMAIRNLPPCAIVEENLHAVSVTKEMITQEKAALKAMEEQRRLIDQEILNSKNRLQNYSTTVDEHARETNTVFKFEQMKQAERSNTVGLDDKIEFANRVQSKPNAKGITFGPQLGDKRKRPFGSSSWVRALEEKREDPDSLQVLEVKDEELESTTQIDTSHLAIDENIKPTEGELDEPPNSSLPT